MPHVRGGRLFARPIDEGISSCSPSRKVVDFIGDILTGDGEFEFIGELTNALVRPNILLA
jgi:hypothetical protein